MADTTKVLKLIKQAERNNARKLDLSGHKLTSVPTAILNQLT